MHLSIFDRKLIFGILIMLGTQQSTCEGSISTASIHYKKEKEEFESFIQHIAKLAVQYQVDCNYS